MKITDNLITPLLNLSLSTDTGNSWQLLVYCYKSGSYPSQYSDLDQPQTAVSLRVGENKRLGDNEGVPRKKRCTDVIDVPSPGAGAGVGSTPRSSWHGPSSTASQDSATRVEGNLKTLLLGPTTDYV